jgi:tRNA-binding protein
LNYSLDWQEFEKVEMRVGILIEVNDFQEMKTCLPINDRFWKNYWDFKIFCSVLNVIKRKIYSKKQTIAVVNFSYETNRKIHERMFWCLRFSRRKDNGIVLLISDIKVKQLRMVVWFQNYSPFLASKGFIFVMNRWNYYTK